MEIPIKKAKVRRINGGKYPTYAISVPIEYVKNGLLDCSTTYEVVIKRNPEAKDGLAGIRTWLEASRCVRPVIGF